MLFIYTVLLLGRSLPNVFGPSFLAHPLYTLFVNSVLVIYHDIVLTDTFWEDFLTSCIIIKDEKLSYFSGNQSLFQAVFHFSAVLLTLCCEKGLLFHSAHASSENLGLLSDSPYQGSLEFYIHSTRMLLSRYPSFI